MIKTAVLQKKSVQARENQERPESQIYFKIFEKTPCISKETCAP